MSDQIDRAAQAMWDAIDDKGIQGRLYFEDCRYLAQALAAADLLASPARDAAVAAKALRDAADGMVLRHVTSSPEIDPLDYDTSLDYAEALAETYLYVQADLIEREGGESDADA